MNLKQEVRAAWVAQEIKRLWPKAEAKPKRAFKTERPPKEQSSRAGAAQPAQPPGDTRPPAG